MVELQMDHLHDDLIGQLVIQHYRSKRQDYS
jgi:hypothetical protein